MSVPNVTRAFVASLLFWAIPSSGYDNEIQSLVSGLRPKISEARVKAIAVVDFTDLQGCVSEFGRLIAEDLSVAFAQSVSGFEVVDRTHLKTLLAEYKLSSSGIIDPATAKKLGSIAGVSALVTGTVTPFGETVKVSAKVIDTETARLIAATTGQFSRTDAINELLGTVLPGACPGSPTPPQPDSQSSGQPTPQTTLLVSVDGYDFRLTGCGYGGGQLSCSFLVTNRRADRRISIYGMRLIDDRGTELRVSACALGGNQGGGNCSANLARDIPMSGSMVFEMPTPANVALLELTVERGDKVQWKNLRIMEPGQPRSAQARLPTTDSSLSSSASTQGLGKAYEVIYDEGGWFAGVFSESTNRMRYCRGWIHVYPGRVTFQSNNCQFSSHFDHSIAALTEAKLNRSPLLDINLPAFHIKVEKGKNYNFASRASQEIVHAIQGSAEYRGK